MGPNNASLEDIRRVPQPRTIHDQGTRNAPSRTDNVPPSDNRRVTGSRNRHGRGRFGRCVCGTHSGTCMHLITHLDLVPSIDRNHRRPTRRVLSGLQLWVYVSVLYHPAFDVV